jgi:hypothetical protein
VREKWEYWKAWSARSEGWYGHEAIGDDKSEWHNQKPCETWKVQAYYRESERVDEVSVGAQERKRLIIFVQKSGALYTWACTRYVI